MANKTLFQTIFGGLIPATDTVNSEKAPAYALSPKQALAQYAATGCFNRTFGGRSVGARARAVPGRGTGVCFPGGDLQPPELVHERHAGAAA